MPKRGRPPPASIRGNLVFEKRYTTGSPRRLQGVVNLSGAYLVKQMYRQFDLKDKDFYPHFTIPGTMPGLNEYLAEVGRKPQIGGKMKREYKMLALSYIRRDLRKYKATKPIILHYVFYEPNMKRDHDNVFTFCSKCVQDALQDAKVIENDGWKQIVNFTHDFFVDRQRPRIEVYIEEVDRWE